MEQIRRQLQCLNYLKTTSKKVAHCCKDMLQYILSIFSAADKPDKMLYYRLSFRGRKWPPKAAGERAIFFRALIFLAKRHAFLD